MQRVHVLAMTLGFLAVPLAAGANSLELSTGPSTDAVQPVGMNLLAGFIPPVSVIKVHQTVTWVNNDILSATHTVDGILGAPPASGNVAPGQTYTATFHAVGAVPYKCTVHPWMNGVIVVTP